MEISKYILIIIISAVFLSCQNEEKIPPTLSDIQLLSGTWRYQHIIVNGDKLGYLDSLMEFPSTALLRNQLTRRKIIYFDDGTYTLDWIRRGEYQFGTYGDSNYQPRIGYYQLKQDGENLTLTHNKGITFETVYEVKQLTESSFIRVHQRRMSKNASFGLWQAGELVEFEEVFVRDNPN